MPDYLADVNEQAEDMLFQFVEQMAKNEGVDEAMKCRDQIGWVRKMNNIRSRAEEIVLNEIIFQSINEAGITPRPVFDKCKC